MTERGVRELLLGTWRGRIGLGVLGLFVFVGVFGSALAPDNPDASSLDILAKPSTDHWLGTTEQGSDVFSQLLVGALEPFELACIHHQDVDVAFTHSGLALCARVVVVDADRGVDGVTVCRAIRRGRSREQVSLPLMLL